MDAVNRMLATLPRHSQPKPAAPVTVLAPVTPPAPATTPLAPVQPAPVDADPFDLLAPPPDASAELLVLRRRQSEVLKALMAGAGPGAAAEAGHIGRATLYRWMKNDEPFQSAIRAWHDSTRVTARGLLHAVTEQAANVLAQRVREGDLKAALAVLRGQGILTPAAPHAGEPEPSEPVSTTVRRVPTLRQLRKLLLSLPAEPGGKEPAALPHAPPATPAALPEPAAVS
jgi:hypothetical protein